MKKQNSLDIASTVIVLVGIAVAVTAALEGIFVLAVGAGVAVVLTGFTGLPRIPVAHIKR